MISFNPGAGKGARGDGAAATANWTSPLELECVHLRRVLRCRNFSGGEGFGVCISDPACNHFFMNRVWFWI